MTKRILPPEYAWCLYGIAKRSEAADGLPSTTTGVDGAALVAIVEEGELAAFVSAVPLAEFAADRVRSLAQDDAWLGRIAREHERVVDALQRRVTIVPARLFSVYASDDDIRASLAQAQSSILETLERVAGGDEYEIRFTFDRASLGRTLSGSLPEIAKLMETRAAASAGRAYLLDRQIATLLKRAVDEAIDDAAAEAFAHLRAFALAESDLAAMRPAERESPLAVLRRAFLVRRSQLPEFLEALERTGRLHPEIRVGYSGPWPPYNFLDPDVAQAEESMHG